MNYDPVTRKLGNEPDWVSLHNAAVQYDRKTTEATLALVVDAFRRVSTLEKLTLTISADQPGNVDGLSQQGFSCSCDVQLRVTPGMLMLPQLDRQSQPTDVTAQFKARGGTTDEEFRKSLGNYFEEVWPAFNDRAHLFGGVGRVTVDRQKISELLAEGKPIDLAKAVKEIFEGQAEPSKAANLDR